MSKSCLVSKTFFKKPILREKITNKDVVKCIHRYIYIFKILVTMISNDACLHKKKKKKKTATKTTITTTIIKTPNNLTIN